MVRCLSILLAGAVLCSAPAPLAGQRQYRLEVGGAGGFFHFDSQTELASTFGFGLRLGYWVTGPLSLEVEGTYARPRTDTPLKETVPTTTIGGWALANLPLGRSAHLILKAGYGRTGYGSCPAVSVPGSGPCGSAGVIQGGIGTRIALTPTLFMRYDATVNRSLTTLKFSNVALQGGVSLMLGSRPLVDSDGDGVYDRGDRCPDTRLGSLVDKRGCPTDQDGDGVADGLDRCPNTQQGAAVDDAGCSQDTDGDGYLDGVDQCPDTPKGALVDHTGCPSDSDHDSVLDGLDRCPDTPAGAAVDALGCPGDSDADGVFDGLDECPDTRRLVPVDVHGCPTEPEPPSTPLDLTWILPGSVWELRGSELAPTALPALDSVVAVLEAEPRALVEVNGFAYDRLVPADNTRLSQIRAEVVRDYLVAKGVDVSRITAVGRGSEPLLDPGNTEEARTRNRRVEIRVTRIP